MKIFDPCPGEKNHKFEQKKLAENRQNIGKFVQNFFAQNQPK